MPPPLSAVSLLLASFAVLFGLWHPIAAAALKIVPKPHRTSRNEQIAEVRDARWRMVALFAISIAVSLIFAKRTICIIIDAIRVGGPYDDIAAAFVAAECILVALSLMVGWVAFRLWRLYRKLDSKETLKPE